MKYCPDLFNYRRRMSHEVTIGSLKMGGVNPVRLQSMTNTSTLDTEGSVEQAIRIFNAGGELVRLTAQGVREAENLQNIRFGLIERGYRQPISADIHFNPAAAEVAAQYVEKVRINPGNFVDSARTFKKLEYDDESYRQELEKIRAKLIPLLEICRRHHTALRLGVNHGSLSDRIMSRYGDTPAGMVESCMEFLRICCEENFDNIVISIKASNTVVMVQTVRLLVSTMFEEGMSYPLHLGVTEAGDAEDGRIKSAVGIGALLADGIGDTIRVSLSEDPEKEIPVALKLMKHVVSCACHLPIKAKPSELFNPYVYQRREALSVGNIGDAHVPVVVGTGSDFGDLKPDYLKSHLALFTAQQIEAAVVSPVPVRFVQLTYRDLNEAVIEQLKAAENIVVILSSDHVNPVGEMRAFFHTLMNNDCKVPVILYRKYMDDDKENFQVSAAADLGVLFIDGFGDGIWLENPMLNDDEVVATAFGILQASRVRTSKTEYISCPGCGRTLFDLQTTIAKVKEATKHFTGLKIGIMGCIVNGPGEMADADYGYVGAGKGKVSLYRRKECVEKNISEEDAVDKLLALIKEYEGK
ncbi:(E)-4-hydroxy-3-methylbut-2-enyl-diphosphate synthase [Paludibacter sp.]|uniref:(E)-4-hydroxy-3-methylbut-2-enyl-diphosphate synthase n=1 Tax=Paludibacter sp. TaxID=1898105 RepID=UPI001354CFF7|nr:(E)-4-hydroxy-3-methylbut-2-enyl-diphosphate synthase [Paludibacter sp.]MTK52537.1 (E)-4-hydroxy-3-methylbut-2-enyl-diphosphate synthase [Paludibacter sp.]